MRQREGCRHAAVVSARSARLRHLSERRNLSGADMSESSHSKDRVTIAMAALMPAASSSDWANASRAVCSSSTPGCLGAPPGRGHCNCQAYLARVLLLRLAPQLE
jgi:hypothetical protein